MFGGCEGGRCLGLLKEEIGGVMSGFDFGAFLSGTPLLMKLLVVRSY